VGLVEIWVEERSWGKIEKLLNTNGKNEERRKEERRSRILEIFGNDIILLIY
jgi:hypothetical protein